MEHLISKSGVWHYKKHNIINDYKREWCLTHYILYTFFSTTLLFLYTSNLNPIVMFAQTAVQELKIVPTCTAGLVVAIYVLRRGY